MRIFEDNGITFDEKYAQNAEHWVDELFNGGRKYQRSIDQKNMVKFFDKQREDCIGCWSEQYDPQVPDLR